MFKNAHSRHSNGVFQIKRRNRSLFLLIYFVPRKEVLCSHTTFYCLRNSQLINQTVQIQKKYRTHSYRSTNSDENYILYADTSNTNIVYLVLATLVDVAMVMPLPTSGTPQKYFFSIDIVLTISSP